MAIFQVDSGQLATAAAATRSCAGQISAEVAAMMTHLATLEGSWTGAAAGNFATCSASWRVTQNQVEAALAQIGQALDAASAAYSDAETRAASLFAG